MQTRKHSRKIQMSILLSQEMKSRLEKASYDNRISQSQIIEDALKKYLQSESE